MNLNRNPGFLIKMNLNVYIICVAAITLLAVPALADNSTATINGGVYSWDTFEPLENAVVEVNSTPSQSMVAKYGVYSFELEPGDYLIKASYYQNSTLIYSAEESIEVKGEGSYVVDLLLLPVYSEEFMTSENIENTGKSNITQPVSNNSDVNDSSANASVTETKEINGVFASSTVYYLLAALLLSLIIVSGYSFKKRRSTEKKKPEKAKLEKSKLLEEKTKYETERPYVHTGTSDISAKEPFLAKEPDKVEPETEQELPPGTKETQLSEESGFKLEKEKQAEYKAGQFTSKIEPAAFEEETGKDKETFVEETSQEDLEEISLKEPEPAKLPESEAPVIKKNLPLPADLQEIMDIIRGQGGRITQKDLRSKLKYSEGKVSLMLADLERRELIEKFKRGRGNVIILRDEER